jgi:peptidoglycan/xylan/chitin deacetylase (PgdA/CDA1 family)/glycosyltransferase involved in cell wall biosynthesis
MNVLMALSQLEVTGAEVYAATVGDELSRRGHSVFYVSDTFSRPVKGQVFRFAFNKRSLPRRLWHVAYLIYFIKKHRIQLVHAHSRASAWSCAVACRLTGTPFVTTAHGRQRVRSTSKAFPATGYRAIAICEEVRDHLINNLGVAKERVEVIRNGFRFPVVSTQRVCTASALTAAEQPVITFVGRFSGPKGDLCFRLLDEVLDLEAWRVQILSSSPMPERFEKFMGRVEFLGYAQDVAPTMMQSSLVIGAGRVAVEALLCKVPVFAIGESCEIGLVSEDNLALAMRSNFGDIGQTDLDIDFAGLRERIAQALSVKSISETLHQKVRQAYDLGLVVDQIESVYQDAAVATIRRDIPVVMYHRFIKYDSEKGVNGTWIDCTLFERHLKLLKWLGYETLTFRDFADKGFIHRLQYGKRYVMITADDGYVDNLTRMLPLLKRYGFRAVVYVVTGEDHNRWDVNDPENPDVRVNLMSASEVQQLAASGHVEIGGHTVSHQRLTKLSPSEQRTEILQNKRDLESITGQPVLSFAYPYGELNEQTKRAVAEAGYQFAVATDSGPLLMHADPLQIRRFAIFPRTDLFAFWRKVRGDYAFRKFGKSKVGFESQRP